jgi:IS5 family transposase
MSEEIDRDEQEAHVARKRLVEEIEADNEVAALAGLLQSEPFRDYLWKVITRCGVLNDSWDANYGRMSYKEGQQSIGRQLIADINAADPQAWLSMQLKAGQQAQQDAKVGARQRAQRARSAGANP